MRCRTTHWKCADSYHWSRLALSRSSLSGGTCDCFARDVTRIANTKAASNGIACETQHVWGSVRAKLQRHEEVTSSKNNAAASLPQNAREIVWVSTLHNCLPWFSKIPAAAINNCLRESSVSSMLKAVRCSFVRRQATGCNYSSGSCFFFSIRRYIDTMIGVYEESWQESMKIFEKKRKNVQ